MGTRAAWPLVWRSASRSARPSHLGGPGPGVRSGEGVVARRKPREHPIGFLPLWLSYLAGPTVWSAHLLLSYLLVSVTCHIGLAEDVAALLLHALTVLAAL